MVAITKDLPRGGAPLFKQKKPKSEKQLKQIKKNRIKRNYEKVENNSQMFYKFDQINLRTISAGMKFLGVIKAIHDFEIKVSLPGRLIGTLPMTNISDDYNIQLKSYANYNNENDEDVTDLRRLLHVGQLINTVVVEDTKKIQNVKKFITLSLNPKLVNSSLTIKDLKKNMIINCTIKSVEDHGYILETGLHIQAFLSEENAKKYIKHWGQSLKLPIGHYLRCEVEKDIGSLDNPPRIFPVSIYMGEVTPKEISPSDNKSFSGKDKGKLLSTSQPESIDALLPGTLIMAKVVKKQRNGYELLYKDAHPGFLPFLHVPQPLKRESQHKTTEPKDLKKRSAPEPDARSARLDSGRAVGPLLVTYVNPFTKAFAATLLPHLIDAARCKMTAPTVPALASDALARLKRRPIARARVIRVISPRGQEITPTPTDTNSEGLPQADVSNELFLNVYVSLVGDDQEGAEGSADLIGYGTWRSGRKNVQTIKPSSGSFLACQVIDWDAILNLAIVTFGPASNNDPGGPDQVPLTYEGVTVGSRIRDCVVSRVTPQGLVVTLGSRLRGFIPALHISDYSRPDTLTLAKLTPQFPLGRKLTCRVLDVKPEQTKLILTHKRSLVQSQLKPMRNLKRAHPGLLVDGFVAEIMNYGLLVAFYNSITGLVPLSEIGEDHVTETSKSSPHEKRFGRQVDLGQFFYLGQVLRCRVVRASPEQGKMTLSLKLNVENAPKNDSAKDECETQTEGGKKTTEEVSKSIKSSAFEIGKTYKGTVTEKTDLGFVVDLNVGRGEPCTAFLPVSQLSDFPENSILAHQAYAPGAILSQLILLSIDPQPIVSRKAFYRSSMVQEGSGMVSLPLPEGFDFVEGSYVSGTFRNSQPFGIFVGFPDGTRALVHKARLPPSFLPQLPPSPEEQRESQPSPLIHLSPGRTILAKVLEVKSQPSKKQNGEEQTVISLSLVDRDLKDRKGVSFGDHGASLLTIFFKEREELWKILKGKDSKIISAGTSVKVKFSHTTDGKSYFKIISATASNDALSTLAWVPSTEASSELIPKQENLTLLHPDFEMSTDRTLKPLYAATLLTSSSIGALERVKLALRKCKKYGKTKKPTYEALCLGLVKINSSSWDSPERLNSYCAAFSLSVTVGENSKLKGKNSKKRALLQSGNVIAFLPLYRDFCDVVPRSIEPKELYPGKIMEVHVSAVSGPDRVFIYPKTSKIGLETESEGRVELPARSGTSVNKATLEASCKSALALTLSADLYPELRDKEIVRDVSKLRAPDSARLPLGTLIPDAVIRKKGKNYLDLYSPTLEALARLYVTELLTPEALEALPNGARPLLNYGRGERLGAPLKVWAYQKVCLKRNLIFTNPGFVTLMPLVTAFETEKCVENGFEIGQSVSAFVENAYDRGSRVTFSLGPGLKGVAEKINLSKSRKVILDPGLKFQNGAVLRATVIKKPDPASSNSDTIHLSLVHVIPRSLALPLNSLVCCTFFAKLNQDYPPTFIFKLPKANFGVASVFDLHDDLEAAVRFPTHPLEIHRCRVIDQLFDARAKGVDARAQRILRKIGRGSALSDATLDVPTYVYSIILRRSYTAHPPTSVKGVDALPTAPSEQPETVTVGRRKRTISELSNVSSCAGAEEIAIAAIKDPEITLHTLTPGTKVRGFLTRLERGASKCFQVKLAPALSCEVAPDARDALEKVYDNLHQIQFGLVTCQIISTDPLVCRVDLDDNDILAKQPSIQQSEMKEIKNRDRSETTKSAPSFGEIEDKSAPLKRVKTDEKTFSWWSDEEEPQSTGVKDTNADQDFSFNNELKSQKAIQAKPHLSKRAAKKLDDRAETEAFIKQYGSNADDRVGDGKTNFAKGDELVELEKMALASPNSSLVWTRYMAYHLRVNDVASAKCVGRRALETISHREEQEKLNVWAALLNLDHMFGSEEEFDKTLNEALSYNEPKKVYSIVAKIYADNKIFEKAQQTYEMMVKKYGKDPDTWLQYGQFLMHNRRKQTARSVMEKSFTHLDKKEHVGIILNFAQMEFEVGDFERGKTLIEKVLDAYPKRTDVWARYVDALTKHGDTNSARSVLERLSTIKLSSKRGRQFAYKKFVEFEAKYGTLDRMEYVKSLFPNMSNELNQREKSELELEEDNLMD